MRIFVVLLGVINAACLVTVCLLTAVELPAFNMNFYSMEYDRYSIPQSIRVEKDGLMEVTEHMLQYLRDQKKDLVVYTEVEGIRREFFNDLEKAHMVDVKNLIMAGTQIRIIALSGFLCTIFLMYFMKVNPLTVIARANRAMSTAVMVILFLTAAVIMVDFERAFTIFHLIFFDNDMWILNPQTDLLINIVPLPFFIDISKWIAAIFVGFNILVIIASTAYLRFRQRISNLREI